MASDKCKAVKISEFGSAATAPGFQPGIQTQGFESPNSLHNLLLLKHFIMTKRKNTADILKPVKPKRAYKKKTPPTPPVVVETPAVVETPCCPEVHDVVVEDAPVKLSLLDKLWNWLLK